MIRLVGAWVLFVLSISSLYAESIRIRAMTGNLSSGNRQNYDGGEGLRIFKGLQPQIVMIQEFNYKKNTDADLQEFIQIGFGENFHFYRESERTDALPNGIISQFPIKSSGEWDDRSMPNRDFAWAQIDIPGDTDLWAISVHLKAGSKSANAQTRRAEAEALVEKIKSQIPKEDYVLIGGDFNTTSRTDPTLGILSAVFLERGAPEDSEGNTETNRNQDKNYDWLLADEDLEPFSAAVVLSQNENKPQPQKEKLNVFSTGLVFNSSTFLDLSLVAPVIKSDSLATGMQHLAVVKDFLIPVADLPATQPSTQPATQPATTAPSTQP